MKLDQANISRAVHGKTQAPFTCELWTISRESDQGSDRICVFRYVGNTSYSLDEGHLEATCSLFLGINVNCLILSVIEFIKCFILRPDCYNGINCYLMCDMANP